MALIVADRVQETSTTTGTGALTLLGATTGNRAASSVCANGDTFTYYAEAIDANERPTGAWETGLGTWGTGNILTRTTIYASSNAGAAVSWAAGTKRIGLGLVSIAALGPTTVAGSIQTNNSVEFTTDISKSTSNKLYRNNGNLFFKEKQLNAFYERTISNVTSDPALLDYYYEIGSFAFSSLQGIFTIELVFDGSGFGSGARYIIPTSYGNDYLSVYSDDLTTTNNVWVIAEAVIQTPRHVFSNSSNWELQFKVNNNTIDFRLVIRGSNGQTMTNTAKIKIYHSDDFNNSTYTEKTGTGVDTTVYERLPLILSTNIGKTLIQNNLNVIGNVGIGTTTPTVKLEVVGNIKASNFVSGASVSGTNTGDQTLPTALPTPNAVTFTSAGGAAAGITFNGSTARTIDYSTVGAAPATHTHSYQAADGDLLAIAGLVGTTGLLKKTAADTWTLDTTAYTTNTGTVTSVATGNGMNFTTFTASGTVTLGTPSTCTNATTNAVSATSHTHAITGFLTAESDTLATVTSRGNVATSHLIVPAGEGNAVGFWASATTYSIAMGVTADTYQYGPVTDYSIKMNMAGGAGRGFTWGQNGVKPIAALNSTSGDMTIAGSFSAASKSFLIKHPTKPDMQLRYGSLESPYHGVRLTGEGEVVNGVCVIHLPDYIHGLCKQEGAQVQITNIKHGKVLWVDDVVVDKDYFTVACDMGMFDRKTYKFYWSFTAVRKDIDDLEVECV